jgi:hypothetical protein
MTEPERSDHIHGIRVKIDGVAESDKLSTLTVGQFIELLFQVSSQTRHASFTPDSQALSETIGAVRAIIADRKDSTPIEEVVRKAQEEILKRMPGIVHQGRTRKPNDGGPSPFAKSSPSKG